MYKVVNDKRKKWWAKEQVSRKWRNWCQNEVYEEKKVADSRDKVKHNERSDQLFLEMTTTTTSGNLWRMFQPLESYQTQATNYTSIVLDCITVQSHSRWRLSSHKSGKWLTTKVNQNRQSSRFNSTWRQASKSKSKSFITHGSYKCWIKTRIK